MNGKKITLTLPTLPADAIGVRIYRSVPEFVLAKDPATKHKHHLILTPDREHKVCWCGASVKLRRTKRRGARRRT